MKSLVSPLEIAVRLREIIHETDEERLENIRAAKAEVDLQLSIQRLKKQQADARAEQIAVELSVPAPAPAPAPSPAQPIVRLASLMRIADAQPYRRKGEQTNPFIDHEITKVLAQVMDQMADEFAARAPKDA